MATNLFFVMHAKDQMFWEMVKIARVFHDARNYQFRMLASWRNSRNHWFREVLRGADSHILSEYER